MKKRIIIIGDSFSLGVGADFPELFDNAHWLAPKIDSNWFDDWKRTSGDLIKDQQLQRLNKIKENESLLENQRRLSAQYIEWTKSVFKTKYFDILKEQDPFCKPEPKDLMPGLRTQGHALRHYPNTWSNQLGALLPDTDVINLSSGGRSMASVVSALSTFISMDTQSNEYETLVFFQAPDPCRKQYITTEHDYNTLVSEFEFADQELEHKLSYFRDYNVTHGGDMHIGQNKYNFAAHNTAYVVHDLYIGEWFQNIFNAQQICKANNFHMAWCSSQESVDHIETNKNNLFPNVLDLDIRLDRMPHTIDKEFASLVALHRILGTKNLDFSDIYSGCMHFTGKTQTIVANYMAKSLISNEEFWWQK